MDDPDYSWDALQKHCRCAAQWQFPELLRELCEHGDMHHLAAQAPWFHNLPEALLEYQRRYGESVRAGFYLTNIGRDVWRTLDHCLEQRDGGVIEGQTGRSKSAAVKAWCDAHRGEARLVTLPGFAAGQTCFRAVATALGLNVPINQSALVLRERATRVLRQSGLMLVIDEAHHLLPERGRRGQLDLINWLDSAVREAGVPVVLVTTPQFAPHLADVERRNGWNAAQFRRRFSGAWRTLDESTTEEDLRALAARLMPQIGAKGTQFAAGYALSNRDVSGLVDLTKAARARARLAGREEPVFADLRSAFAEDRKPTENAMDAAFRRPLSGVPAMSRPRRPVSQPTDLAVPPRSTRGIAAMPPPMLGAEQAGDNFQRRHVGALTTVED